MKMICAFTTTHQTIWLSKKNCLAPFYLLFDAVVGFLQSCNSGLTKEVIAMRNGNDIAYFSQIGYVPNLMN